MTPPDKLRQPPPPKPITAGIEDNSVSTSEEALPVPLAVGEVKVAVKWVTRIYNQRAQVAPQTRAGKK